MRYIFVILALFYQTAYSQQSAAFTHITTEDGTGLASNVVLSLYQDQKGFMWVGTANGIQRFDGSKFVSFNVAKPGSDPLPQAAITQIIPADSGKLFLVMSSIREFGIFNPSTFTYKKIPLKTQNPIPVRAQFWGWRTSGGQLFITISGYGFLGFDKNKQVFTDKDPFHLPKGWQVGLTGVFEDTIKQQFWIAADSGLCIFDKTTNQLWSARNNPRKLPAFDNKLLQDNVARIYIDRQRRIWTLGWSRSGGGQYKHCFDSTGTFFLAKDTAGLMSGPVGYSEYTHFYEPKKSGLWIYGSVLFNWDKDLQRFFYNKSSMQNTEMGINYESICQLMEDKDGNLWIATDRGLYFTAIASEAANVANLIFSSEKNNTSITDVLEMPNGDIWLTSWGEGVKSLDKFFRTVQNDVYATPFPKDWTTAMQGSARLSWALCRESSTGNVWIGCNEGFLLIHDPVKKKTTYLQVPECNKKTIRFIAEDRSGDMWLGTQGGRVIKYSEGKFVVMQDLGTVIYKIMFDKEGWMWLATHEKGMYAIDPSTNKILQHYTTETPGRSVYSNTALDIEQLNDSIIVYGAGVLNFINKKKETVRLLKYEDGLPSNNVIRLRVDKAGFLWIVTSNGLCRYNPNNNRITAYGRKDGVMLADRTNVADYACANGELVFAGSNAVVMFNPSIFSNNQPPPDVSITDFQLFNHYIPVDSLMQSPVVKLQHDQNSFTIYFSSLSYMQKDKLTYYYKMEGLDNEWIRADRGYFVNYSLLPPGKYTFKIYSENLEGMRSLNTTEMHISIKPPFWRTWWFRTSILFVIALVIYDLHNARVKRLLAVEKLRNKVARDLHDDMGSTLSTINILTSMAKTKMHTDVVKTTEYLGKISDNSQRMMEAMDDIVWSIKPSNDNMNKVTARMREFATNVLEAKEIDLEFVVDEKVYDEKLNMEARKDFFLIFKEAVNNAAKYSKACKVVVHISTQQKNIILSVKDDGVGFDVAKADSGNGLGNMQKRAEAMRGVLKFESSGGQGTNVILKIPIV